MSDRTENLRDEFLRAVRRRLRPIRGFVRRLVGYEKDIFGLATDGSQPDVDTTDTSDSNDGNANNDDNIDGDVDVFRFQSRRKNLSAFGRWFQSVLRDRVLKPRDTRDVERGDHWTGELLRLSYAQGWRQARNRLRQEGVSVGSLPGDADETDGLITALGSMPVPRRSLQEIYLRAYENLQSIENDMIETVRSTLAAGLRDGVNPREMAARLTKEIRGIQRTRAEMLARTETVNAYTSATIDRYRQAGIRSVTQAEFSDADDARVCPVCSKLDGRVTLLTEIETATMRYTPDDDEPESLAGEYPVKPPAHPACRCVLLPVV